MKRSEFIACLIKSFGGKQQFADAVHEALTSTSYGESHGHLWHLVLGLLESDREGGSFGPLFSSFMADVRPPQSVLMRTIEEFKQSKEFAGLGHQDQRATDAFLAWATRKSEDVSKAAE